MTLEVVLWAIPAASLTAASALIAFRAWRLTRDGVIGQVILAVQAGNLTSALRMDEANTEIPVSAKSDGKPRAASGSDSILMNPRLCPVPIVVCGGRRSAA